MLRQKWQRILILCCSLLLVVSNIVLAADLSKLVILHTNDTHGFDQRAEGINGLATVAAFKKHLEAQGKTVVLLDAGDAIQDNILVNFSQGKSAISFMNACGYDAATLGNHEFDYGQDVLLARMQEAKYPFVSCNVMVKATGKSFIAPSTIINKNGYKIGVVGITTPETATSTNPKNVRGLDFLASQELYAKVQQEVDKLKAANCDFVVGLAHLGSGDEAKPNRSDDVVANVRGMAFCIDGHDHKVKNFRINNTLIVETGSYTKNIGMIVYKDGAWQEELQAYGAYTEQDEKVKALVAKAAAEVKRHLAQPFGKTTVLLNGKRVPGVRTEETNLADFCTDAFLWQAQQASVFKGGVDAAIINGGNIRDSIQVGTITRGHVMAVLPYNNQLVVVKVKGEELLEMLEAATCVLPDAMGALPQVSGIKYEVNTRVAYTKGALYEGSTYYAPAKPGSRVKIIEVAGRPFALDATYAIVASDFICNGGDAYGALLHHGDDGRYTIGYTDEQAVENYLREVLKGKVGSKYALPQGRITIIK